MEVLSGILRAFLAAFVKFRQSKPKGFSFLNSRNQLKNASQTSSKINLNSFLNMTKRGVQNITNRMRQSSILSRKAQPKPVSGV